MADYYMYVLEFDTAAVIFQKEVDSRKDQYGSAALCLALISAERGDFKVALRYLNGYSSAFGSGCGNCLEARDQFALILRTLWQLPQLPPDMAKQKLRDVISGNSSAYKPLPGRLTRPVHYKKRAIREARLILAGMLRREGKTQEAIALYRTLQGGSDMPARFAKAYLAPLR
jgi:hypothetical protein